MDLFPNGLIDNNPAYAPNRRKAIIWTIWVNITNVRFILNLPEAS